MIKKTRSIPLILGLLMLTGILSACSSWFQPKTKTIEYDEQVKLHNGEMIWVHITRHYFLAGEIAHGSGYMPGAVEIIWDTGFPGVGRKSVFFDHVISIIDNYDNKWFVAGVASSKTSSSMNAINCMEVGNKIGYGGCILVLDSQGNYLKPTLKEIENFYSERVGNILNPYVIESIENPPNFLDGKKISWQEKIDLQLSLPKKPQTIGKKFYLTGVTNYE